jgi:uncharacterized SAM-binding protein YcdF (DUF218 family)
MTRRSARRIVATAVVCAIAVAVVPATRRAVLRAVGGLMVLNDPIESADVGVTMESVEAGALETSDLYHRGVIPRIVVLVPAPTTVDQEFAQRGVQREDLTLRTLTQLGVPPTAIATVEAGEAGTTESTQALAEMVRLHSDRVIVVVSPNHTRRFRRTLLRVWPANVPPPRVTSPRANLFRAEDWWVSRRTRRDGFFELERLAWDYVRHPW